MTQEEKDLLLKDICARLHYGVKVNNELQVDFIIYGICENYVFVRTTHDHADFHIEKIKPYLFPLSSLTKEQEKELEYLCDWENGRWSGLVEIQESEVIDYLNKNHFDYRGLIEKGLAIDATGLNIY